MSEISIIVTPIDCDDLRRREMRAEIERLEMEGMR
jgi:hypothetical protein